MRHSNYKDPNLTSLTFMSWIGQRQMGFSSMLCLAFCWGITSSSWIVLEMYTAKLWGLVILCLTGDRELSMSTIKNIVSIWFKRVSKIKLLESKIRRSCYTNSHIRLCLHMTASKKKQNILMKLVIPSLSVINMHLKLVSSEIMIVAIIKLLKHSYPYSNKRPSLKLREWTKLTIGTEGVKLLKTNLVRIVIMCMEGLSRLVQRERKGHSL